MAKQSGAKASDLRYAAKDSVFPSTHWSLIHQAGGSQETRSREALDELIRVYRPALMNYLLYVWRMDSHFAEDLLHNFLTEKVVRNRLIAHADQRRGRFRAYLKTVLNNYVRSEIRRMEAQKRAPDRALTASSFGDSGFLNKPEGCKPDVFDIEWARTLLQQALDLSRSECIASGKEDAWEIFSCRLLKPILEGTEPESYEKLISRFNFSSPSQVRNALTAAKSKLTHHLKILIATYAKDESEVNEEIADLFKILSC